MGRPPDGCPSCVSPTATPGLWGGPLMGVPPMCVPHGCPWPVGQASDGCPSCVASRDRCLSGATPELQHAGSLHHQGRWHLLLRAPLHRALGGPARHGQPKMSRSASESAGSSGRCHFAPSFHLLGLAFLVEAQATLGPFPQGLTTHTDAIRLFTSAKGLSTTQARMGSWPWEL